MKVLVCGDRNWTNKDQMRIVLKTIRDLELIIEGGARGADKLAGEIALELGIPVRELPADWDKYGRAAGPIRNKQMLNERPDLVLAFHDNIAESRGTRNMLELAKGAGVPTRLCTSDSSSAGIGFRDKQYKPPGYDSVSIGSGCIEGGFLSGFRIKSIDISPLLREIPNYKDIIRPKPDRVFLLEEAHRVAGNLNLQPLFKVVGVYGRPGGEASQLFIIGRDRHTGQPFALGIPNGFVGMPVEVCLRWTLDAHKGDKITEI